MSILYNIKDRLGNHFYPFELGSDSLLVPDVKRIFKVLFSRGFILGVFSSDVIYVL